MAALYDPDAAILGFGQFMARSIQGDPDKAGIGPLPDIAGDIQQSVLIAAEAADRVRLPVDRLLRGLALVTAEPARPVRSDL
jgi:hypothetical protein